jgi:hypothetical protein
MKISSSRAAALSGRLVASVALATAMLCCSTLAAAQESSDTETADTRPGAGAMTFDLLLGRPLGLGATVLGTAVFIVGLPFEALSGNVSAPAKRLVKEPAAFTFTRPLGQFN